MDLLEVMRTTGAVRDFTDEPVGDDVLHGILDAARFAPNGGNRQAWNVIVLRDEATRRQIRDLYVLGWREYAAHTREQRVPFAPGPDGRWVAPAIDLDEARRTPAPNRFAEHLDTAPVLLVVVARLDALAVTDNGLDRQSIVGGASIYPFCHNVLLAARNAGLGGVLTSVLARQEPTVKSLLHIPDGHAVAALLAIGHPVKQVTRLRREPVEAFTTVDRFDGPAFS